MAGGRAAVGRSGRAAGAGFAGFRRAGQIRECLADVAEPAADPGGGEPAGRAGPLPGQPQVGGQVTGEAELGVAGEEEPGPPVGGGRVPQFRPGPAENLLEEPEHMFDIEAAQERLPGPVHLIGEVPAREDRGSQYTSGRYRDRLFAEGIIPSVGHTGICYDNAAAESFNATIKKELIYQHVWRDAGEVRTAVFDYIERYYNHVRKQRRLGKISPADYERQLDNRAPKAA